MEDKKGSIKVAHMSKEDQEKYLTSYIKKRKYMVEVEIMGKKKFAYCDDMKDLDEAARNMQLKILKVTEIKKDADL